MTPSKPKIIVAPHFRQMDEIFASESLHRPRDVAELRSVGIEPASHSELFDRSAVVYVMAVPSPEKLRGLGRI